MRKMNSLPYITREAVIKRSALFSWAIVRAFLIAGISFIILYPLITKISRSFMQVQDIYDMTVRYFPKNFTLRNFELIWIWMDLPQTFFNTTGISLIVGICQTISATIVAYGFARYKFKGSSLLFSLVIIGMVIPPDVVLVPLYLQFKSFDIFGLIGMISGTGQGLNLSGGFWPFILLGLTCTGLKNGLYVFLMRQYFLGMPKELEEAAFVDGAGSIKTFIRIMIPGAIPMMVTVFLFSYVWQWLDVMFSSVFLNDIKVMTISLSSLGFVNDMMSMGVSDAVEITLAKYAGIILLILPLVVVYIFCQRFFVQSVERSGLVG